MPNNANVIKGLWNEDGRIKYLFITMTIMLFMGVAYSWSVFADPLQKTFGWSAAQTALTFTISFGMYIFMMIVSGRLSDKYGSRIISLIGGVVAIVGFILASFTTSLAWIYFSYGILVGGGMGMIDVSMINLNGRWFEDKIGSSLGFMFMALGLGGLLLGVPASGFIQTYGWQAGFRFYAICTVILVIIPAIFIKFPEPGWKPSALRLQKENINESKYFEYEWQQMISSSPFLFWFVWCLVIMLGGLIIISAIAPMVLDKGMSAAQAALAMGAVSLGNGLGRLFFGWLSDKIGRKKTMAACAAVMSLGLAAIVALANTGYFGVVAGAFCAGAAYGGGPVINSVFIARFGMKNYGLHVGIGMVPVLIAILTGPYIGGLTRDIVGSYDLVLVTVAIFAAISVFVALLVNDPQEVALNKCGIGTKQA